MEKKWKLKSENKKELKKKKINMKGTDTKRG